MKHYLLIDGENFVHGLVHVLRSKKIIRERRQLAKINIPTLLASAQVNKEMSIRYYSTRVQMPAASSALYETVERMRQWNAKWVPYIANQGIEFISAGILKVRNSKRCSKCNHRTEILLEKGVDVRLGVDAATLADQRDTLYIWSSDSDLIPALHAAKQKKITVVYIAFEGSINYALRRTANKTVVIKKSAIVKAYKEANK